MSFIFWLQNQHVAWESHNVQGPLHGFRKASGFLCTGKELEVPSFLYRQINFSLSVSDFHCSAGSAFLSQLWLSAGMFTCTPEHCFSLHYRAGPGMARCKVLQVSVQILSDPISQLTHLQATVEEDIPRRSWGREMWCSGALHLKHTVIVLFSLVFCSTLEGIQHAWRGDHVSWSEGLTTDWINACTFEQK